MITGKYSFNRLLAAAAVILLSCFLLLTEGCSERPQENIKPEDTTSVSIAPKTVETAADTIYKYRLPRPVNYSFRIVKGAKTLKLLDSLYGKEGRNVILTLNRLDEKNLRYGDTLLVPDTIAHLMSYSPFPYYLETASSIPKLLLVSRYVQAFAAYQNGVLIKWGPVSSGRKSKPTPAGLFHMNWKSRETISTIDDEWILPYYFNFQNMEGVALHQYDLPGYPASHACVRLLEKDAIWVYYWAEQWIVSKDGESVRAYGTPIIVFDEYPFGKRRPWRNLLDNPDAVTVSEEKLNELLERYRPTIWLRLEQRNQVLIAREMEKLKKDSLGQVQQNIKTAGNNK